MKRLRQLLDKLKKTLERYTYKLADQQKKWTTKFPRPKLAAFSSASHAGSQEKCGTSIDVDGSDVIPAGLNAEKNILSIRQMIEKYPFLDEYSIRWMIYKNNLNFHECLVRRSKKIFIDDKKFFAHLEKLSASIKNKKSKERKGSKKSKIK